MIIPKRKKTVCILTFSHCHKTCWLNSSSLSEVCSRLVTILNFEMLTICFSPADLFRMSKYYTGILSLFKKGNFFGSLVCFILKKGKYIFATRSTLLFTSTGWLQKHAWNDEVTRWEVKETSLHTTTRNEHTTTSTKTSPWRKNGITRSSV